MIFSLNISILGYFLKTYFKEHSVIYNT